jgi:hypothetical protein
MPSCFTWSTISRAGDGVGGRIEGREEAIAGRVELATAMSAQC